MTKAKAKEADKQEEQEELNLQEQEQQQEEQKPDEAELRIAELQKQMKEADEARKAAEEARKRERAEREKAEKERDDALAKSRGSENDAVSAKERELFAAKSAVDSNVTALEDLYQKALEAGDSAELRKINTQLQKALITQSRIEEQQQNFAVYKKQQEEAAKQPRQQQQPKMSDAAQAWVDRNPRYTTDADFRAEAEAAHVAALRRGMTLESSAYFKFIDDRLAKVFPSEEAEVEEQEDQDEQPQAAQAKRPAAPPARGNQGGDGGKKNQRKLTAAQLEAADFMKMTPVEYAKHLDEIEKEGKR